MNWWFQLTHIAKHSFSKSLHCWKWNQIPILIMLSCLIKINPLNWNTLTGVYTSQMVRERERNHNLISGKGGYSVNMYVLKKLCYRWPPHIICLLYNSCWHDNYFSFALQYWFRRTDICLTFFLLDSDFHTSNSTFRQWVKMQVKVSPRLLKVRTKFLWPWLRTWAISEICPALFQETKDQPLKLLIHEYYSRCPSDSIVNIKSVTVPTLDIVSFFLCRCLQGGYPLSSMLLILVEYTCAFCRGRGRGCFIIHS